MDDLLNNWLGIDLVELKRTKEVTDEKRKAIAVQMVKLSEYPEWPVFESELLRLLKEFDRPCEVYSQNPDLAKEDTGGKRSVQVILNFIKNQRKILEEYAKEKTSKQKDRSGSERFQTEEFRSSSQK